MSMGKYYITSYLIILYYIILYYITLYGRILSRRPRSYKSCSVIKVEEEEEDEDEEEGPFLGVKCGRRVLQTTHPLLVTRSCYLYPGPHRSVIGSLYLFHLLLKPDPQSLLSMLAYNIFPSLDF